MTEVEKRPCRCRAQRRRPLGGAHRFPVAAAIRGRCRSRSRPARSSSTSAAGSTEVAVVGLGGIVVSRSIQGSAATRWTRTSPPSPRREYNIFLRERTAEDIEVVGSAYPGEWDALQRHDLLTRLLGGSWPTRSARRSNRRSSRSSTPSRTPSRETRPELVADIMDQGIVLAGGGALLAGLDRRSPRRPRCRSTSPTIH